MIGLVVTVVYNALVVVVCGYIAVEFRHWWIILFALALGSSLKVKE